MPADLTPNQLKWVEALESGEYKQDTDRLGVLTVVDDEGNTVSHCCLGVACELAVLDGVAMQVFDLYDDFCRYRRYETSTGSLPSAVVEWLNIGASAPMRANWRIPMIGAHNAAQRNDDMKQSFEEIAAAIREHGLR